MKRIICVLLLLACVSLLVAGCVTGPEGKKTIDPTWWKNTGKAVRQIGEATPQPAGSIIAIIGAALGAVGVGASEYQRRGKKRKAGDLAVITDAMKSVTKGVDKALKDLPPEAAEKLKDALFREQAKANTVATVAKVRNGG